MQLKKNIAISENGFLFDPSTGDAYSMNAVGLEILNLIKKGLDKNKIISHMIEKYDVEESAFERYFYDFTAMLRHHHIMEDNGED